MASDGRAGPPSSPDGAGHARDPQPHANPEPAATGIDSLLPQVSINNCNSSPAHLIYLLMVKRSHSAGAWAQTRSL